MSDAFQDQVRLREVRDALFNSRGSRACVMVGSGFSRNAENLRPELGDMPTWPELGRALAAKLAVEDVRENLGRSPPDPKPTEVPELAQEYEATFDRASLRRFLESFVRDDDFGPGQLHRRLLQLPWCDVFTTNWDTLLEKTSSEPDLPRRYSVLRRVDQLPLKRAPRVVKLHGSLGDEDSLVVTQGDYQTYSSRSAPFVDLVRLAMMEKTFVLLGFSGADPNFRNWLGWVSDNLGKAAPKVYLAGLFRFRDSKRLSLESQNVVPVDLAGHPAASSWDAEEEHKRATEFILQFLESGGRHQGPEWWPASEGERTSTSTRSLPSTWGEGSIHPRPEPWPGTGGGGEAERRCEIKQITTIWRDNRERYPDWLVLPFEVAERMRAGTDAWERVILKALPEMGDAATRLEVLHELVWRREVLLDPLLSDVEPTFLDVFEDIDCQGRTVGGVRREDLDWTSVCAQWKSLAAYLVTTARQDFDREEFDRRIRKMEPFLAEDHELRQRLHYEECLWALNVQDWQKLEGLLEQWRLGDGDHAWLLRKAALLAELNQNEEALRTIRQVLRGVRNWRGRGASMAGPSMEAWALWMEHVLDGDPFNLYDGWREFVPYRCDLLAEIGHHENVLSEKRKGKKPKPFELGARPGATMSFSTIAGRRAIAAFRAIRFSETVGLPAAAMGRLGPVGIGRDLLGAAADALRPYSPEWAAWLTARCAQGASGKQLGKVFSRSQIAFLPLPLVRAVASAQHVLIDRSLEHIPASRGGGANAAFWRERLQASMEALSRCVVRLGSDDAAEVFSLAQNLYRDGRIGADVGFGDPLWSLLRRSWESLPTSVQSSRVLGLLALPIVGLDDFPVDAPESRFRDPAQALAQPSDRRRCPAPERCANNEKQWKTVVNLLDRTLKGGGEARKRASGRLSVLASWKRLTAEEERRLAASLWGSDWEAGLGLPKGAGVHPWIFAVLPEPRAGVAVERLRRSWSSPADWREKGHQLLERFLTQVGGALGGLRDRGVPVDLSVAEERVLRVAVEHWAAMDLPPVRSWPFQEIEPRWRTTRSVARLLLKFRVSENAAHSLGQMVHLLRADKVPAYQLVPGVLTSDPEQTESLAWALRLGLASSAPEQLESAAYGLFLWLEAEKSGDSRLSATPHEVLGEIGVILANRRWSALSRALDIAEWVFRDGTAEQRQVLRGPLLESLRHLRSALVYEEDVDGSPFIERPWVNHDEIDVPLLRWRCARAAVAMKAAGFGEDPAVAGWLNEAETDPLPEMRFVSEAWQDG